MATEFYPFAAFVSQGGTDADLPSLEEEVIAVGGGLASKFEYSEKTPALAPTGVTFTFTVALTAGEQTQLDAVVAAHQGTVTQPVPEQVIQGTLADGQIYVYDTAQLAFTNVTVSGDIDSIDAAGVVTINNFTDSTDGFAPASGGGTANFLRADGTWAVPPGTGGGGAPTDAQYVVLTLDATLTDERVLVAGAGLALTDGGPNGNVTLDIGAGTGIVVNANDVQLDLASTRNTDHTSVVLTAGAGLAGGGDITASRTFDVGAGTGIVVNANDVQLDLASNLNVDHSGVNLTAGAGLTGGGDITASRTFDVGAGTGITVNADDIEIDTTFLDGLYVTLGAPDQTITSQKTFDQAILIDDIEERTAQAGITFTASNVYGTGTAIWTGEHFSIGTPRSADRLIVGYDDTGDDTTTNAFVINRTGLSGFIFLMSNAPNPQFIVGDNSDTGTFFVDGNGNKDILFQALDTGPGVAADKQTGFGVGGIYMQAPGGGQINIEAPNIGGGGGTYTLTLPADDGLAGQFLQTDGAGVTSWQTIAGGGNVTGPGSSTDEQVVRFDGATGTLIQGEVAGTFTYDDTGVVTISAAVAGHVVMIQNTQASGELMNMMGTAGNLAVTFNQNGSDGGIFRVFDGTVTEANVFEVDGGGAVLVNTSGAVVAADFTWPFTVQGAATGQGARVLAGEIAGDIAFRVSDQDDTFGSPGGAIVEFEADQGHMTLGKSYAQTLLNNGVVYGVDQQGTGATSDFNTQVGTYRIGGEDVIETYPGVIRESGSTNITVTEVTVGLDTIDLDPASNYTVNGSSEITVGVSGYYRVSYTVPINEDSTGGSTRTNVRAFLQKDDLGNNTFLTQAQSHARVYAREASGGTGLSTSFIVLINATDQIRVRIDEDAGVDLSTETGQAQLSIERVRRL